VAVEGFAAVTVQPRGGLQGAPAAIRGHKGDPWTWEGARGLLRGPRSRTSQGSTAPRRDGKPLPDPRPPAAARTRLACSAREHKRGKSLGPRKCPWPARGREKLAGKTAPTSRPSSVTPFPHPLAAQTPRTPSITSQRLPLARSGNRARPTHRTIRAGAGPCGDTPVTADGIHLWTMIE
jgi:hypothetical protein